MKMGWHLEIFALLFLVNDVSSKADCEYRKCEEQGLVAVKSNERPYSNGCSVPSFIQLPDFQFDKCCDLHDSCYMSCGINKNDCEADFNRCLKRHCKDAHKGNKQCEDVANTFVTGVRMFGCNGYVSSQATGCTCVEKEKVHEHNQQVLTNFYQRYNQSKTQEEISDALIKHKGKEGKMWSALYKKYPQSIQIVSRDGQSSTENGRGDEL
jgi:hypothetical protein